MRVAETVVDGERPSDGGPRTFDRFGLLNDPPLIAVSAYACASALCASANCGSAAIACW